MWLRAAHTPGAFRKFLAWWLLIGLLEINSLDDDDDGCACADVLPRKDLATDGPVCGNNGLLYASTCIAACQDALVVEEHLGCMSIHLWANFTLQEGWHDMRVLNRFRDRGYAYLGMVRSREEEPLGGLNRGVKHVVHPFVSPDLIFTSGGLVYGRGCAGLGAAFKCIDGREHMHVVGHPEGLLMGRFGQHQNVEDGRKRVISALKLPWMAVGKIGSWCTGAMIGISHVLTAAHCVYDAQSGKYDAHVSFSPASNGDLPFGSINSSYVQFKGCWTDSVYTCDFAVIKLEEDIGLKTGWLDLGTNFSNPSASLRTAGYPNDKDPDRMWRENCGRSILSCTEEPAMLIHKCSAAAGMSGAPIWDRQGKIRLLHVGYQESVGNLGVYITPFVLGTIELWVKG